MDNKAKRKTFTELDLEFPVTLFDVKDENLVDKHYELYKDSVLKQIKDKIDNSGKYSPELRNMSLPFIRELQSHNRFVKRFRKWEVKDFCFPNSSLSEEELASKVLLLQKFATDNFIELSSYVDEFHTILINTEDTLDRTKVHTDDYYSGDDEIFAFKELTKYIDSNKKNKNNLKNQ
ncbi:hypothetical protein LPB90_18360 [Chryseobacterium sp. LC2016-29]|uniref:hypothetical protein n=1 Tax=Chryseobacterium sp. LC2016-29 TaxID=2897331 RepID=UPI001E339BBF|nr:hypothetical protein [Chryseobacterium sp. LC2016-29]MCD0480406.1 hypothetical protein [Chryseobacterium sp. LC2016-29]